jgi:hypothetical protein
MTKTLHEVTFLAYPFLRISAGTPGGRTENSNHRGTRD